MLTFETPDRANAALFGDLALSINDESADYGATAVASFILGETGSSRLWKRIRERDGLSYGVYYVRRLEFVRAQLHPEPFGHLRAAEPRAPCDGRAARSSLAPPVKASPMRRWRTPRKRC